jgi:hypothetical protein
MAKKETMMEAFLRQSNIDPNNAYNRTPERTKDIVYSKDGNFVRREERDNDPKIGDHMLAAARASLDKAGAAFEEKKKSMTRIRPGSLDETPVEHPYFAKYNHSLEVDRWSLIGGKGGGSGDIEMGNMTSEDM